VITRGENRQVTLAKNVENKINEKGVAKENNKKLKGGERGRQSAYIIKKQPKIFANKKGKETGRGAICG